MNITELSATTRLTCEFTLNFSRCFECFTVRYHWRTNITFNFEFTFHAVNKYIKMKLTHTADDNLAGFIVSTCSERRVFFLKFHKSCSHLIDRKSTRLNSSHVSISYAVFCLKKKKIIKL